MTPGLIAERRIEAGEFPFLDLKAQYASIRDEVMAALEHVMESQHFILGEQGKCLEAEIAALTSCHFAIGCASGSDALALALMVIGIGAGGEVITVPFTFGATAGAILRVGAIPVFVDIEADTFNLDPARLEQAITPKTKAIIAVHLFGQAAEMSPILAIATRHGIPVIEDAAQAIGARYNDKPVGSFGQFGCFSFFPSKNLGGAGDGGMVTTQDSRCAEVLKVLRAHGSRTKYQYERPGINSRLDEIQAAILRVKLAHLQEWTAARNKHANTYRRLLAERGLEGVIGLPRPKPNRTHVYNQFVIRAPERDALRSHLRSAGIPTEIYYPSPLHLEPAFATGRAGDCPIAEQACREVVALPIFPELTAEQQDRVVHSIAEFYC